MKKIYYYLGALLLMLLSFVLMPKQVNADFAGTDVFDNTINIFQDVTWNVLSTQPLTMSGFTIGGAPSVTWNSDNLLFYGIIRVLIGGGSSRRLATVNPSTGVCTDIGPMGGAFSSLTYSSTTGILYAMGGDGGGGIAERLYSININTGVPTFLAGPYPLSDAGEVIAYNYDDGFIYHWSGAIGAALMEKIDPNTFVATPVPQTGISHGVIFGAVYMGGGNFQVTDNESRALTITSGGVVSLEATGLPFDVRGLGYIDPLLPVELSSFTSTVNRRDVNLNWTTVSELNNSGFNIERSIDHPEGSGWSMIGNVHGNGTTTTLHSYSFTDRGLSSGKYNYRLKQIDFNGNFAYYNLRSEVNVGVPGKYDLSQNYPNPFNPSTKINYDIPFDGKVSLNIFDLSGREIATLVNDIQVAGYYTINFNAANLASGVYFYIVNSGNFVATKKMIVVK
ncbi:MAG: T9SS type A sorting domain-containing protein [Bacteroidota bacterium]|nr:T9SS type A sorting domain-containing protein [Bacteroidota bacterium]